MPRKNESPPAVWRTAKGADYKGVIQDNKSNKASAPDFQADDWIALGDAFPVVIVKLRRRFGLSRPMATAIAQLAGLGGRP